MRTKRKGRPGPRLNSMPPLSDRRTRSESPSVPGGTAQLACSGPERRAGAIAVTLLLLDLEGTRRVHLVRGEGRDLSGYYGEGGGAHAKAHTRRFECAKGSASAGDTWKGRGVSN